MIIIRITITDIRHVQILEAQSRILDFLFISSKPLPFTTTRVQPHIIATSQTRTTSGCCQLCRDHSAERILLAFSCQPVTSLF